MNVVGSAWPDGTEDRDMKKLFGPLSIAVLLVAACETTETRVAPSTAAASADQGQAARKQAPGAPANVLAAARDAVPGLVVTGTETEIERGVRIYDVRGTANGRTYELEVTADGRVTEIEDGDDGEDDDGEDDDEDGDDDDDGEDDEDGDDD
jgi:ribonuclease E